MKIGYAPWYGDKIPMKGIETAHRLGFDYTEICLDYPWLRVLEKSVENMKRQKREFGMDFAFHAPWAGIYLAHPCPEIRAGAVGLMKKCLKFAANLDPAYFNLHLKGNVEGQEFPEVQEMVLDAGIESAKELSEIASNYNIQLTIENNDGMHNYFASPQHFEKVMKIKRMKMCFDIGHACVTNQSSDEGKIKEWFSKYKSKILVSHVHNCVKTNIGWKDHCVFEYGALDIEKIFERLKRSSCKFILPEIHQGHRQGKRASEKEYIKALELTRTYFQ